MKYRCVATSVEGFVQQLAVVYITHGYWFYVAGKIPEGKDPAAVDAKLICRYGIGISKWARYRRKSQGLANVQYLRYDRFFVLVATKGRHTFFEAESNVQDIRRQPLRFGGYSVGYGRGADTRFHVSVRIAADEYLRLRSYMVAQAAHHSKEYLRSAFGRIPFEHYAPVRAQLLNILRAVNRARRAAGFQCVPLSALRFRRRSVRPFEN